MTLIQRSYEDLYTGFKTRLAYGQVDYTSNGTGFKATGVPDYQFETTGYLGLSHLKEQTQEQPILQDWDLDIY